MESEVDCGGQALTINIMVDLHVDEVTKGQRYYKHNYRTNYGKCYLLIVNLICRQKSKQQLSLKPE